jgi:uncharacterized protein (TIGR02145 family)
MKKIILVLIPFFCSYILQAQNVGIGTLSPGSKLTIATNTAYSNIEYGIHGLLIGGEATNDQNLFFGADNTNGIGYIQSVKRGITKAPLVLNPQGGNVAIGTVTPKVSAKLEIASTNQGFLPPRMTLSQRNAIATPADGLVIFCYDCDELQVYSMGQWKNLLRGATCAFVEPNVPICSQIWMQKNLDVTTYRNGDVIPQVTGGSTWASLTTGAWCYVNNNSALGPIYGKMYNWYAVNDPRGLAPHGWHIPNDAEWATLATCLGGNSVAGGAMKETGFITWVSPNTGATNTSGFTGLGGGYRQTTGGFVFANQIAAFWSSTSFLSFPYLKYDSPILDFAGASPLYGNFVRCVRD